MSELKRIGVVNDLFRLVTVEDLIEEDVLDRPMDGNHGEQHPKLADYVYEGIPFVMANDLSDGSIDYDSCSFITKSQADRLRKGFSKPGDVLVTHKATIGRTALVGIEAKPYIMLTPQVTYYRVKKPDLLDNRYLRHFFDDQFFQKTLAIWAGAGSTRAYLGITDQRKLPIILPPPSQQRKIAAILTAYDDLVDTNKRRVALLEKMGEELYKEWFVRMRFPGHEGSRFIKGVPADWRYERLDKLCLIIKRGVSPAYSEASVSLVINQKCIRDRRLNLGEARRHSTNVPEEKIIRYADALVNSTGVGTLGRVCCVEFEPSDLTVDSHVTICRANDEAINAHYLSHTICQLQPYFEFMAAGSTGQVELNKSLIDGIKVRVPPRHLQNMFAEQISSIWDQKQIIFSANARLTEARDLLLPRLISGKLSVRDLDIQLPPSMQQEDTESEHA